MSNEDFLELIAKFGELERQLRSEIIEYKKTVNNAIGLLSKELLDFTTKDVADRKKRQFRQDVKDVTFGCFILLTLIVACSMMVLLIFFVSGWRYAG